MGLFDKKATVNSLEELTEKWKECRKCPLRIGDSLVCGGRGSPNARVMIVGQSPTKNEAITGIMMEDRGGQEIRQWFYNMSKNWNMSPDDLYFTNCVKCPAVVRNNFNKPLAFIDEEGNRLEDVIPANECGMYLEDEIRLIKPELIVAIGSNALHRFGATDPNNRIPKQLDKARKRLWTYRGIRFIAITMPTRLNEENIPLEEDYDFLSQVFDMKTESYKPKPKVEIIKSLEDTFLEVDKCQSCPLSELATCKVFGTGNHNAELLFVGEAPGQKENEQGIPFIGPAGRILHNALIEVGIDDKDIYITNAIKCWPGEGNPTPDPAYVQACSTYLQTQVKQVRPKIIVTLGAVALEAITRMPRRVGPVRGTYQKCWFYQDAIVIPTWHPSYVMRDQSKTNSPVKKEFIKDLQMARGLLV